MSKSIQTGTARTTLVTHVDDDGALRLVVARDGRTVHTFDLPREGQGDVDAPPREVAAE